MYPFVTQKDLYCCRLPAQYNPDIFSQELLHFARLTIFKKKPGYVTILLPGIDLYMWQKHSAL